MQYMRLVYEQIAKTFQESDDGQQLRALSEALAEGIGVALGLLGVETPQVTINQDQLRLDADRVLQELQRRIPKANEKL